MKIQKKILTILLTITLFSHLIVTMIYFAYSQNKVSEQAINHLSSLAKIQYQRLDFFIQANREKLQLIQSRTQMRRSLLHYQQHRDAPSLNMVKKILGDAIAQTSSIDEIFILGLDGQVIYSTSGLYQGSAFQQHPVFTKGNKEEFVSLLFSDNRAQSPPVLFSAPLMLNGQYIGVIGTQVNMDDFYRHLTNYTGLGETGEVLLATSRPSNKLLFFTPLRFSSFPLMLSGDADSAYPMKMALEGKELILEDKFDYRGEAVFAVTKYIAVLNAGMVVKMDRSEVLAYNNNLKAIFVYLVMILVVVIVIVSVRLAKKITTPVIELTKAAHLISKGHYNERVNIGSKDELGNLGKAINTMADKLIGSHVLLEEQVEKKTIELVTANKRLEELAQTDCLTKLKTRRYFDANLERDWSRCQRHQCEISVLMVDIDFFKQVNDNMGHQVGDQYLKSIAHTLSEAISRKEDTIARYGGEEFVVVLTDISHDKALYLAESIRARVESLQLQSGCHAVSPYITVSIGVHTTVPQLQESCWQLVKQADRALYEAKASGRNRVKSWSAVAEQKEMRV